MSNLVEPPSDSMRRISAAELRQVRHLSGLRTVEHFVDLGSTNDRAMRLIAIDEIELPALVVTDHQTAGRGRGPKSWWATPGALTFSLILPRPLREQPNRAGCIALAVGLAVCEAVRETCPASEVGMKWPNDVEVQGRKVSGILVEIPPDYDRCVVGIGVNVNNSFHDATQPFSSRAASLRDLTGKSLPLHTMLSSIITQVLRHMELLDQDDPQLPDRWHDACSLKGARIRVEAGSQHTEGLCEGIGRDGALLVRDLRGLHRCHSGSVTRLG
jgi:BirA family biotin operon repressor/biotin-[acetyl-CoA-carboxylase] ligase